MADRMATPELVRISIHTWWDEHSRCFTPRSAGEYAQQEVNAMASLLPIIAWVCRRAKHFVAAISPQISLYDFVVGLLNYCVDGKEHLSRLAFDVYDRHTTGTITEADLEGMLIDVWGPNW